jgi:magnesium chelatase family protein
MTEFNKSALEVMRQPLEDREVHISRAKFSVTYPCSFVLIAAINPCPCGYYNHPTKDCQCAPNIVQRYLGKISGPVLDRIDMHIEVVPVDYGELASKQTSETSLEIRKRVVEARKHQTHRFQNMEKVHCNAEMNAKMIEQICEIPENGQELLKQAMQKFNLSARAHSKIIKLSRTIADLDGKPNIEVVHLAEAIQYRSLDKNLW